MPRPTDYSEALAAVICEQIASGRSLRDICSAEDMPEARSVFRWLAKHPGFCHQYARAREAQADALAEEILEIADTTVEGVRTEESDDGFKTVREDMLGHRRLQVDTRKWLMARLAPKKYGDKVTLAGDKDAPLALQQAGLTPAQVRDELREIFGDAVPARPAAGPAGGRRVVRKKPRKGSKKKRGAPAPG